MRQDINCHQEVIEERQDNTLRHTSIVTTSHTVRGKSKASHNTYMASHEESAAYMATRKDIRHTQQETRELQQDINCHELCLSSMGQAGTDETKARPQQLCDARVVGSPVTVKLGHTIVVRLSYTCVETVTIRSHEDT